MSWVSSCSDLALLNESDSDPSSYNAKGIIEVERRHKNNIVVVVYKVVLDIDKYTAQKSQ